MQVYSFRTILEKDNNGTWWYVHVPLEMRQKLKQFEKRGIIAVQAQIGTTNWEGSLLPWADGSAQITVNKKIRDSERLELGQVVDVTIKPR